MASITKESNYQRKAHRINIPIMVSINNINYTVLDWSTTGLRIEDSGHRLSNTLKLGEEIKAMLILPTGKSSVLLELTIALKSLKSLGFEITEMEEKNRRVLRHYATLSIEGNGQRIEDLMSDITMANVESPIKESIALSEDESKTVHMSFLQKAFIYVSAGVLLFLTVIATMIYNYAVVYHDPGLSTGNNEVYMASVKGKITNLYVKKGSSISPGMLLYQIDNEEENYDLKVEEEKLASLQHKLVLNEKLRKEYKAAGYRGTSVRKAATPLYGQDAIDFEEEFDAESKIYERARSLYEKRLITLSHYNDATRKYQLFLKKYNKGFEQADNNKVYREKKTDMAEYHKNLQGFEDSAYNIEKSISRSLLKIDNHKRRLEEYLGMAKHAGTVHSIKHKEGEYADYGEEILVVETDEKPYILTKMMSYDAVNVNVGQECVVYSKTQERKFKGIVTGIGYSSTDSQTKMTTEISQNEIPVRIELVDNSVRFHLNTRVDIWIMRKSELLDPLYDMLLWNQE